MFKLSGKICDITSILEKIIKTYQKDNKTPIRLKFLI